MPKSNAFSLRSDRFLTNFFPQIADPVESEHFPGLAPSYARLETVLGLLEARARDWERFYVVTVIEPDVPVRVLTFDGDKMQKLLPIDWERAA